MALTYTQLVADKNTDGSIKNWLNYSLLPVETILTQAQALIYERLRVREMQVEGPFPILAAADNADLPAGFLDPIQLLLDGDSRPIDYVHENLLGRMRDEDGVLFEGTVCRYAVIGAKALFDVKSSEARTGYFWYYATPAELSGDVLTNFLTARYPSLLLAACEAYGFQFRRMPTERDSAFKMVFDGIESANVASDMARRGQTMR